MLAVQADQGLADYFPFLFPNRAGAVVVLTGCFDESERFDGHEPICVGGFLFRPSGYKKFRRYWQSNVLRFRGQRFKHFHMTDLCAGHGEYEHLSIADRLIVLNHAVHAINANALGAIGIHFNQAEFERKAPRNWPDVFGSIYTVACNMCLQATAYWLKEWRCQLHVLYVFEQGHKFEEEADEFLDAVGRHDEARKRFRYRKHMFEPKSEVGLQAADLYAWTITKCIIANGTPPRAMRPFVESLVRFAAGQERYKLYPFIGDKLDRFLVEHLTRPVLLFAHYGPRKRAFR